MKASEGLDSFVSRAVGVAAESEQTEHVTSALSFTIGVDGVLLEVSHELARVLGYGEEEIVGKDHHTVLSFDSGLAASWYLLREGEHQFVKVKLLRRAPLDELCAFCCFSPVHDAAGKLTAVRACFLDVTSEMTEGFATGAELNVLKQSQAVACFGLDGAFLDANRQFLDMMGFSLESLAGRNHMDLVDPALAASREYAELWVRLSKGECLSEVITHVGSGGRELGLFAIFAPVVRTDGTPWKVVMYAGDVQQHKAEEQAKSLFLASLSRELRAPLDAILGVIDFAKTTVPYASYRSVLDISLRSTENLLAVLDAVVASEPRAVTIEHIPFNLNAVIEGVLLLVAAGKRSGVEVTSFVEANVPCALAGDPSLLRQVLFCLLSNGVRFTQFGEVCLEVSVESRDPLTIKFEVCDSGAGIPDSDLKSLFAAHKPGIGLGLRMCKEMVGLLNGEIRVKSVLHRGSTFTFTAVFEQAEQEGVHTLARSLDLTVAEMQILSRLSVLVVDANATVSAALADLFKCCGCRAVVSTRSKKEGVEYLRVASLKAEPFDVIVLDTRTDMIREVKRFDSRSVVIGLVDEGRMSGEDFFSGFVPKPVRRKYLLKLICSLCCAPAPLKAKTLWRMSARAAPDVCVLVVDDDSVSREVFSKYLARSNCRVLAAADGAEVLEKLNDSVDVVLMDVRMPVLDGPTAIQIMRSWGCSVPVIAVSADASEETAARCKEAGAVKVLHKPVSYSQLVTLVRDVVLFSRSKVQALRGHD
jgi:PAS domain S-box-containing protein